MRKEIESKVIGKLIQDESFPDWWGCEAVKIPFFDNEELAITFTEFEPAKDRAFIDEADIALANFLALTKNDRIAISDLVFKNCCDCIEEIGEEDFCEELRELKDAKAIWDFVRPEEIYVTRRSRRDKNIYIQIACECDWEEEHGLQLVFRQGKKLTRVSDQDGHLTEADAYDKPDSKDALLSQFDKN